MENLPICWPVSRHATFTSFRTYMLVITFSSGLSIYSFAVCDGKISYFTLGLFVLFYIVLGGAALKLYCQQKIKFITVDGDLMVIPRLGRKPGHLHFSAVGSIEKYYLSTELTSMLVSQKNRAPMIIEKRFFESSSDFHRCVELLNNAALKNQDRGLTEASPTEKKYHWIGDVLALLLIFIYIYFSRSDINKIDEELIYRYGLTKQLFQSREYYRFFTSFSLHYSPFHLLPNVISLSIFGRHIVKIFGTVRFANILFFSTIFASLLSLALSPYDIIIGASGGIFGLLAAHFYVCAKFPSLMPNSTYISKKAIVLILATQLLLDLTVYNGDVFSHLGGGILGLAYAWWAFNNRARAKTTDTSRTEITTSIVLVALFIFALTYLPYQY